MRFGKRISIGIIENKDVSDISEIPGRRFNYLFGTIAIDINIGIDMDAHLQKIRKHFECTYK